MTTQSDKPAPIATVKDGGVIRQAPAETAPTTTTIGAPIESLGRRANWDDDLTDDEVDFVYNGFPYNGTKSKYVYGGVTAMNPSYEEIDPLLRSILEVKRPTKSFELCAFFMAQLLRQHSIPYTTDAKHNFTVKIPQPDGSEPAVCFTSHTDTVHNSIGYNDLIVEKGLLKVNNGGVLGADDGAGIYIMIKMIQAKVPGLYCFFAQEECGRQGSSVYKMPVDIEVVVSFDRKNINHLITHQSGQQCCSPEFADAFIEMFSLPFVKDPTGSYTDSYTFKDDIQECINLSVGYYDQHTQRECQDLGFLEAMTAACIVMDWHALPVTRIAPNDIIPDGELYEGEYYTELEDLVADHPDMVTQFLELYNFRLEDVIQFGKSDDHWSLSSTGNVSGGTVWPSWYSKRKADQDKFKAGQGATPQYQGLKGQKSAKKKQGGAVKKQSKVFTPSQLNNLPKK